MEGCKAEKQRFTKTYIDYFDTAVTVIGYEYEQQDFEAVCETVEKNLDRYHKLFDIYNTYDGINNLCTINQNAGKTAVLVDAEIIDFLVLCKQMYTLTEGNTNIAMGSVLEIWHNYRSVGLDDPQKASVPEKGELENAAKHCNINDIIVNTNESTVFLSDAQMSVDVGAVAKGYMLQRISEELERQSVDGYALNVGGMVKSFGKKADGSDWSVGIENPLDTSKTEAAIALSNMTVVTSGSYQRYYKVDGVRYHHIIDPQTLMPENEYLSVSVLTEDAALGDVLSTALFNMSVDEGKTLLNRLKEKVAVMWIFSNEQKEYYGGFEDYIM